MNYTTLKKKELKENGKHSSAVDWQTRGRVGRP